MCLRELGPDSYTNQLFVVTTRLTWLGGHPMSGVACYVNLKKRLKYTCYALRIHAMFEAKNSKIYNFWIFYSGLLSKKSHSDF